MLRLVIAAFGIIIGAPFQFGYANGVMNSMSSAMQAVFNETGVTVGNYTWNTAWSLTTGLWCAGGGVGALMGGPMAEKLGRKWSLVLNNLFLLVGSTLQVKQCCDKNNIIRQYFQSGCTVATIWSSV